MSKKENKLLIKEVVSTYSMISTVLSSGNILNIIKGSIKDKRLQDRLFSAVGTFISNVVNFNVTKDDINKYKDMIESYYETYLDYNDNIVNDYVSLIEHNLLNKVIKLKYISDGTNRSKVPLNNATSERKNLVFTFDGDNFNSLIPDKQDEVIEYASAFWQITMLVALNNLLHSTIPTDTPELNLKSFNNFIALNIITGVRMMAEYETDVNYGEYFEELCQL